MEIDLHSIGKRIRKLRRNKYQTAKLFAEALNVSDRHIFNIEKGKSLPGIDLMIQIANEFHVTIDFILFGSEQLSELEEDWVTLQTTFSNLSEEGRRSLNHIALELLNLEQKISGGKN